MSMGKISIMFLMILVLSAIAISGQGQTSQSAAATTTTTTTDQLYWSFDKGFEGWERTGSVPPWHTMESAIQWYDQWGSAQGVIVIDACESTPSGYQEVHAMGGIKKSVTLPKNAEKITFIVFN